MIYSIDANVNSARIITEAKFEPSASVPNSLKKVVISICNSILNKSKNLDRNDKKVAAVLNSIEGSIALAKDTSYTDNSYPIEIKSPITGDQSSMEYAISVLKSAGFKHANMKDGKKAQTWYKKSGNDILVATVVGTIIGKSIVTIIMHSVTNNDHNMDIINGISESFIVEGKQADEYRVRKAKNQEAITLYGEAADDFLESVGVELYEEHVVIGEDTYLGADGEAILNENGVYLYEDHIVLEGQQAEEYLNRKEKENMDRKIADRESRNKRDNNRVGSKSLYTYDKEYNKVPYRGKGDINSTYPSDADLKRSIEASKVMSKEYKRRGIEYDKTLNRLQTRSKYKKVSDEDRKKFKDADKSLSNFSAHHREAENALNRNMRRHPDNWKSKNESTIFRDIDLI